MPFFKTHVLGCVANGQGMARGGCHDDITSDLFWSDAGLDTVALDARVRTMGRATGRSGLDYSRTRSWAVRRTVSPLVWGAHRAFRYTFNRRAPCRDVAAFQNTLKS